MELPTVHDFLENHIAPVTLRVIASACGVSRREVEQEVNRLRLEGAPLISDSDGIRWSRDPDELKACAKRLHDRAVTQMTTAQALSRTAERMSGPLAFPWRDAA